MKGLLVVHSDPNGNTKVTRVKDAVLPEWAAKAVHDKTAEENGDDGDMIQCVIDEDGEEGLIFYDPQNDQVIEVETI